MKDFSKSLSFIIIAITIWLIDRFYPNQLFEPILWTSILFGVYFLFGSLINNNIILPKKNKRIRYSLRKILNTLNITILVLIILRIWVVDTTALVASVGFVAAAIAFSLQDVFKNIVGGLMIYIKGLYEVGNRIKIGEVEGDVVDIDFWYTSLLEIKEWVQGDQATGRVVKIPNGEVLSKEIINYNGDHSFIWDEIHIPITFESDWQKAKSVVLKILEDYTEDNLEKMNKELLGLEKRYYFKEAVTEPNVYVQFDDNWISLYARYIAPVHQRRDKNTQISEEILKSVLRSKNISIASETVNMRSA